jgi:hypothetical protein
VANICEIHGVESFKCVGLDHLWQLNDQGRRMPVEINDQGQLGPVIAWASQNEIDERFRSETRYPTQWCEGIEQDRRFYFKLLGEINAHVWTVSLSFRQAAERTDLLFT